MENAIFLTPDSAINGKSHSPLIDGASKPAKISCTKTEFQVVIVHRTVFVRTMHPATRICTVEFRTRSCIRLDRTPRMSTLALFVNNHVVQYIPDSNIEVKQQEKAHVNMQSRSLARSPNGGRLNCAKPTEKQQVCNCSGSRCHSCSVRFGQITCMNMVT